MKQPKDVQKTFIDFILDCEKEHGGVLLRRYLAQDTYQKMVKFFSDGGYMIQEPELLKLWDAKANAKYFSIDYEYINGPGMSY
jgi:hypothetical protein